MWVLNLPFLWCRLRLPLWGLSLSLPPGSPPMGFSPQTVPLIIIYTGIQSAVGSPHVAATRQARAVRAHPTPCLSRYWVSAFHPFYRCVGLWCMGDCRVPAAGVFLRSDSSTPPPLLLSQYGSSGGWGLRDFSPFLSLLPSCRGPSGVSFLGLSFFTAPRSPSEGIRHPISRSSVGNRWLAASIEAFPAVPGFSSYAPFSFLQDLG